MRRLSWPVILLLVLALVVQNTCPHGFAGKTTLASKCSHHRCETLSHAAPAKDGIASISNIHKHEQPPMFVFSVPATTLVLVKSPVVTKVTLLDNDFKDALPEEILKPPRA